MPLDTDFNVYPFFDDYDSDKNYYRILYRPSTAVQARELTQVQSMSHFQIESFGGHMFKDGSTISGCTPTVLPNLDFVRVVDNFTANAVATVQNVQQNYTLVGAISGVRASCVVPVEGLLVNPDGKTNRFYVKYIQSGKSSNTFLSDETINIYNEKQDARGKLIANNIILKINTISGSKDVPTIGKGYGMTIEDGMVFQKGYFQNVEKQSVIVRDFDQEVGSSLVGFNTVEEIITENDDSSLYDNAIGSPNENAPGAYRLKLDPVLVVKTEDQVKDDDKFFAIFTFSKITKEIILDKRADPYAQFGNYLFNRTFDESGNYVVKPFLASPIVDGDESKNFKWELTPGKGYVNGAQVDWQTADALATSRSFDSKIYRNQALTASFGNFVYMNEFSGYFNTSAVLNFDIYDTPQKRISSRARFPYGNRIGTAKMKFYLFDNGIPGTPEARYKVYITDINMIGNVGSFATSAKSFVGQGSTGMYFAADLQLENGRAVVYQNNSRVLIAKTGVPAIKTLNPDGTWDTNFTFVKDAAAKLQPNGYISVTVGQSPYPGGDDVLPYSIGQLNDAVESQIIVTLKTDAYINQLVAADSAVIGHYDTDDKTFARFNTVGQAGMFRPGEYIRIPKTTVGEFYNERVISVINSIAVAITNTEIQGQTWLSGTNVGKYWPAGYIVPLTDNFSGSPRFVDVLSSSLFAVTSGVGTNQQTLDSGVGDVSVRFNMLRTSAQPAKKLAMKNILVKLNLSTNVGGKNGPWYLGFPDVFNISAVYGAGEDGYSMDNEITDKFSFVNGQTDTSYETAQLTLKPQFRNSLTDYSYLVVKLDFFKADYNTGVGFFSVDSYPTSTDINNIPNDRIAWPQIPVYNGGNRVKYDLRDCLDYRLVKEITANEATKLDDASVDPKAAVNFQTGSSVYAVAPDTTILTDIEAYLGRRDYVGINTQGKLVVINGVASENPTSPLYDADFMPVALGFVPPYPSLTPEEANKFSRTDYLIKSKAVFNRGYTMRDIGVLDQRIQNLEYYVALNALEQKAKDLKVTDSAGIDRFKNGIFVDPMNSHAYADSSNTEYRWSIDINEAYGRPMFASQSIDMSYDDTSSQNIQLTGTSLTLPYTNELIISQSYATKVRNATQDYWNYTGDLEVYPSFDMNQDQTILPAQDVVIDQYQPSIDLINEVQGATGATVLGTRYGAWNTTSQTRERVGQVVTVTTEQERSAQDVWATPMKQTQSLDPYITDVSVQPYIKSRTIAFNAWGMKPNTRVYAFFDDIPVSEFCAPGILNTDLGSDFDTVFQKAYQIGKPETIVKRTAILNSPLVTNSDGDIYGVFVIPEGRFKFGDRKFMLMDQDSIVIGNDAVLTRASATFTASNISVTKRGVNITTITPKYEHRCRTERQTTQYSYIDPLGQSFRIEAPAEQSGVMVTKMDLFFKSKNPTLGVSVRVCGMLNNVPDPNTILSTCYVAADKVNISDNASAATTFVFDNPIYLNNITDYAFYVYPEANNPDYNLWVSEIGGYDVTTKAQIGNNPYIGDLFRSSNAKTWVALPREDIKFNVYVANFTAFEGTAVFNNEDDEYIKFNSFVLRNASKGVQVNDEIRVIKSPTEPIVLIKDQMGTVQGIDTATERLVINGSSGKLAVDQYLGVFRTTSQNSTNITLDNLIATMKIERLDNAPIHAICPRFATAIPTGSFLTVGFKGTTSARVKDPDWIDLNFDQGKEMIDYERFAYSKSNEGTLNSKSLSMQCSFRTTNKYISPVIDLTRRNALCIENLLNDSDNLKFEYTNLGTSRAKYISQRITLAEGQDAEDLKVYVTGYRPNDSDITVYVKFQAGDDFDVFDKKPWTQMVNDAPGLFSSTANLLDFKEFTFSVPKTRNKADTELPGIEYCAFLDSANKNVLTYYTGAGAGDFKTTFKNFSVKIVLTSKSGIWCPKVDDVRALAIQV